MEEEEEEEGGMEEEGVTNAVSLRLNSRAQFCIHSVVSSPGYVEGRGGKEGREGGREAGVRMRDRFKYELSEHNYSETETSIHTHHTQIASLPPSLFFFSLSLPRQNTTAAGFPP